MPQHELRTAAQQCGTGMAKIAALRRTAGAASVAAAGLLTVALSLRPAARPDPAGHRDDQGTIVISAQPPHQAAMTGAGHVWPFISAGAW